MTFHITHTTCLTAAVALLLAGPAMAVQVHGNTHPTGHAGTVDSTVLHTPQGQVTVRSTLPPAPSDTTPPSFASLAGKGKAITPAEAAAFPLLANDFGYADSNHNGRVSATEYARWTRQL